MSKKTITIVAILAIIIVVVGLVAFHKTAQTAGAPIQGSLIDQDTRVMPYGYAYGYAGNAYRGVGSFDITLGNGQNQGSWPNNTGQVVYVPESIVAYTSPNAKGTASSTLFLTVGTSTAPTIADATKNALYGSLIDTFSIATSTNVNATSSAVISNEGNAGTNGLHVIAVYPGQYVIAVLESPCPLATTGAGQGCELATSTARGYNLLLNGEYYTF